MNEKQHALAAEIRAEMAARSPRLTATEMQQRTGIKHASWRNWFVTATRPVPYPDLERVADALGVPLAELLRRAEDRAARSQTFDEGTAMLEARLSPERMEAIDAARRARRDSEAGTVDPPNLAEERTLRSA